LTRPHLNKKKEVPLILSLEGEKKEWGAGPISCCEAEKKESTTKPPSKCQKKGKGNEKKGAHRKTGW